MNSLKASTGFRMAKKLAEISNRFGRMPKKTEIEQVLDSIIAEDVRVAKPWRQLPPQTGSRTFLFGDKK
ncbi:MAG TPA: hypothetical protein P5232_02835 [Candidatus Moranbacteria bacterium]|nr:hypothetical protein [Candidatus Moranbacteria bacterium]